jgi:hypothetical protein
LALKAPCMGVSSMAKGVFSSSGVAFLMGELYQVALDMSREKSDPLQKKKTPTKKGRSVNLRSAGRKRRKNYPPIWGKQLILPVARVSPRGQGANGAKGAGLEFKSMVSRIVKVESK